MSEDSASEKEYAATEQKLREARRKGEVPKAQDLFTAAAYGGLLVAGTVFGADGLIRFGSTAAALLEHSGPLSVSAFGNGSPIVLFLIRDLAMALAPFFLIPALGVIGAILAQRAFVVTPAKLLPRLSRISPLASVKSKFGPNGLFDFAKSTTKMIAVSVALGFFLVARMDRILSTVLLEPAIATSILLGLLVEFLVLVLGLQLVVGTVDLFWQHHSHRRKNRMTRRELLDEHKNAEGDPQLKAQRRQRGVEIATRQMIAEVRRAAVIIVNPTHYAVALKWSRSDRHPPICVAKGVDTVAARIRAAAAEAGVPIHSDPATARALHATVEVGSEIRPEHFRAVAAAIRFSEAMRTKARARGLR